MQHRVTRTAEDADTWDRFVARCPGAHYLQLHGWLSSYEPMGFECDVVLQTDGGRITGGAALASTALPLGLGRIFVLPHGPVLRDPSPRASDALLAALDAHFRRERAVFVQAWPPVARDDPAGLEAFDRAGYHGPRLLSSHRFTSTPLLVPLAGRTQDEILGGFRSETRQHYRRAVRRGLECRLGHTQADLRASYEILDDAARRAGFRPRPYPSLAIAFERVVVKDRGFLLQVRKRGELVGAMLVLCAGRVATCYTSAVRREFSWYYPAEFMHVEAMRLAKERGMEAYDLMNWTSGGVAEFKKGFRPMEGHWAPVRTKVYRPHLARLVSWTEGRLRPWLRGAARWRAHRTSIPSPAAPPTATSTHGGS